MIKGCFFENEAGVCLMFYAVWLTWYNIDEVIDMETISFRLEDKEKEELKDLSTGMRLYVKRVLATRTIPFELRSMSNFEQSVLDFERGDIIKVKSTKELMASLDEDWKHCLLKDFQKLL